MSNHYWYTQSYGTIRTKWDQSIRYNQWSRSFHILLLSPVHEARFHTGKYHNHLHILQQHQLLRNHQFRGGRKSRIWYRHQHHHKVHSWFVHKVYKCNHPRIHRLDKNQHKGQQLRGRVQQYQNHGSTRCTQLSYHMSCNLFCQDNLRTTRSHPAVSQ